MAHETVDELPGWDEHLPHFSTHEKGDRITTLPFGPSLLTFFAVVSGLLYVPAGVGGVLFFNSLRQHTSQFIWWLGVLYILYTFLPLLVSGIVTDEATKVVGQRWTAKRIATVPALAGTGLGILGAAIWIGGPTGGWVALAAAACGVIAAIVTLCAWRGIRYTRKRHAWISWMQQYGTRTTGFLREVKFLSRWIDGKPVFTVVVEFPTEHGAQRVTASMVTTTRRVPRAGTAMVVTHRPGTTGADVLIDLDHTRQPRFDPNSAKYTQPSGN
ncbi:hypothetical protein [Mycolicibacterium goodii]|uniref:hypothetical protein n=1 Tax=Mycolicibacterium goodii TaxID=134601 RepID=UPI001BDD28B2|nr:hypothetical protein [Mycolicibacterium goodii]MBU8810163.1 hypothetical protein [Mycolicibacterium goodii]MBU8833846.1 hypothetical protein [Mycolicibacterium goodii]ULN50266.1 hypothetical protein MI170_13555 [Mycolicibacterium goodii]